MDALFNLIRQSQNAESETTADSSYLIVGLGNPGREYRNTRHNVGFLAIDALAKSLNVTLGKVQSKALVGQGKFGASKVILVKPQTYMNLSGQAVSGLLNFYKISTEHLIVIHDDIDLPFGTIRIRPGGGSAGQRGVKSIIEKVGTQEFARMRLGVGRPPGQMDAAAYVLQPFTKEDEEFLVNFLAKAAEAAGEFVNNGLNAAMNKYNGTI
ncbi:MAG: aminoacyl-tRNA hydrolase [Anaerolineaceae bacterium]|nr:aminoacyl-tRNA hydrolase [Anaerolineaceae bacterium]